MHKACGDTEQKAIYHVRNQGGEDCVQVLMDLKRLDPPEYWLQIENLAKEGPTALVKLNLMKALEKFQNARTIRSRTEREYMEKEEFILDQINRRGKSRQWAGDKWNKYEHSSRDQGSDIKRGVNSDDELTLSIPRNSKLQDDDEITNITGVKGENAKDSAEAYALKEKWATLAMARGKRPERTSGIPGVAVVESEGEHATNDYSDNGTTFMKKKKHAPAAKRAAGSR